MKKLSPLVSDAFRMLREDLYRHLDDAETLATGHWPWSDAETESARALIEDLITVIRGVAALHNTPQGDHCRTCDAMWPCLAIETIHRLVKDPDTEFVNIQNRLRPEL
ncbi:MAG TPA: hypothetical protein VFV67_28140 [Actinophytocola sp.]|uniref:hypothetical protein n=1 Tax=Actinophytocola sp. TaxID=1872138 RepID=UPI002DBDCB58|nr:hypothetical protein [Actinophytocola sp.]HEU5474534.1 hypothetical protein [Actinophytocola sp.]